MTCNKKPGWLPEKAEKPRHLSWAINLLLCDTEPVNPIQTDALPRYTLHVIKDDRRSH